MAAPAYRLRADGVDLFVRLTPKAARDAIEGVREAGDGRCHLGVRVRAVPEKGKANAALMRLLADALEVPVTALSIAAGATARLKTVHIAGDPAALEPLLDKFGAGTKA